MKNILRILALCTAALTTQTRLLFADSVNVVETHTSSTKTTSYTILGMDQTTGIVVIAAAVIVLILIVVMASRSSSRTKTETTIIK